MKEREYGIALNWNYIILSLVVISVLTTLVLYLPNMREFDTNLLKSIRLVLSPFPTYIPAFVCSFGNAYGIPAFWPQVTAGCVLVSHKLYLKTFMLILFTQITVFLKDLMKEFVCRPRPDGSEFSGFSFPSGHSCISMCFFGILIYLVHCYVRSDFWRNFLIILFGVWIFMVGLSRLWLEAHFLSDVLAGMFLGFILVNLFIILDKSLSR